MVMDAESTIRALHLREVTVSVLIERLSQARLQVVQCAHDLRTAEADLAYDEVNVRSELVEAVGGDYKQLGPNEAAQKTVIAYRLQHDPVVKVARQKVLTLQHALEVAQATLECALDERIERLYELDLRLTQHKERTLQVFGNLGGDE